jgi:hypothetical protein
MNPSLAIYLSIDASTAVVVVVVVVDDDDDDNDENRFNRLNDGTTFIGFFYLLLYAPLGRRWLRRWVLDLLS